MDPTKEGYEFAGWVDENGDPDDLSNVTADRNVYASYRSACPEHYTWDGNECVLETNTVTFMDGETALPSLTITNVSYGSTITLPA